MYFTLSFENMTLRRGPQASPDTRVAQDTKTLRISVLDVFHKHVHVEPMIACCLMKGGEEEGREI